MVAAVYNKTSEKWTLLVCPSRCVWAKFAWLLAAVMQSKLEVLGQDAVLAAKEIWQLGKRTTT